MQNPCFFSEERIAQKNRLWYNYNNMIPDIYLKYVLYLHLRQKG